MTTSDTGTGGTGATSAASGAGGANTSSSGTTAAAFAGDGGSPDAFVGPAGAAGTAGFAGEAGARDEPDPTACEIASSTDQLWWTPDCPSGVCHNLLLRADGTYQTSTTIINAFGVVTNNFCEHGDWEQSATSCATLHLTPCAQAERDVTWSRSGALLTFADVHYEVDTSATIDTFFIGCNVTSACN